MLILAAVLAAVATGAAAQVPAASSYDPIHAGEVPPGYYQSVPRGAIRAGNRLGAVAAGRPTVRPQAVRRAYRRPSRRALSTTRT